MKVEDSQKMQFSDRLSEIERYQRSMRIGTANNNPRPIHQAHLSTTQGELIRGATTASHHQITQHSCTRGSFSPHRGGGAVLNSRPEG